MKYLWLLLSAILFTSCISMIPERKLHEWARAHEYILTDECPEIEIPEREAQPHPQVPIVRVRDDEGNVIELTEVYLMEIIVQLFGTVEKYQVLVEIYEREYLNRDGLIMPDLSLEELKELYRERLSVIESLSTPEEPTTESELPVLGAASEVTVGQLEVMIEAYNFFQEYEVPPESLNQDEWYEDPRYKDEE